MKILVISPVFPPYKGGMGAVAAQEARLIREAGHIVRVITPRYGERARGGDEYTELVYPIFHLGNAAILPWGELWREIKNADVVHIHYPFFGTALPAACMARKAGKRLVLTWHMRAQAERHAVIRRALFWLHRICEEPLIKRLAHVLCVSSEEYAIMASLPKEKTIVIPFGVDDRRFFPGRNTKFREEHGIGEDMCLFLFVGGMDRAHAFKGVPVLLHAYAKMLHKTHARLLLVGDGDLRETYEQLAKSLDIEKNVVFLGSVSFADLPDVYRAADVHVLPSVSTAEAYGMVTCEAGATGIPSIVSDLPGVRSLVEHKKTGVLVPPGDVQELVRALDGYVLHAENRKRMGEAAYRRISTIATLTSEQELLLRAYTDSGKVG